MTRHPGPSVAHVEYMFAEMTTKAVGWEPLGLITVPTVVEDPRTVLPVTLCDITVVWEANVCSRYFDFISRNRGRTPVSTHYLLHSEA